MKEETTAIEEALFETGLLCPLGDRRTHFRGCFGVVLADETQLFFQSGCRSQGHTFDVVDQLNAGWYGLFAIECMALGKPVVTFLHEEAVRRTEEAFATTVPIVSATAETLREQLRPLVADAAERRRLGEASRAYVELVHDQERITDRLLDVYARL